MLIHDRATPYRNTQVFFSQLSQNINFTYLAEVHLDRSMVFSVDDPVARRAETVINIMKYMYRYVNHHAMDHVGSMINKVSIQMP